MNAYQRHDRPTIPDDLPPPWEVVPRDVNMETVREAARRCGERADRLLERAEAIGLWDGTYPSDGPVSLRAYEWDLVASYRRKRGPTPALRALREANGQESCRSAASRLSVPATTLFSRAKAATGSSVARAPAEWDALAVGMARR